MKLCFRKKAILLLLLILSSLAAVELLCRAWLLIDGLPQSPAWIRDEIERQTSTLTERIPIPGKKKQDDATAARNMRDVLQPYWGFEVAEGVKWMGKMVESFNGPVRKEDYRILLVGGSVAGHFGSEGRETFIETLKSDPRFRDKNIHILDHSRGGFKQNQQASIVSFVLSAGYKPKAVINIDGFNEVALGFNNARHGANPLYPSISHWRHLLPSESDDPRIFDLKLDMRSGQRKAVWIGNTTVNSGLYYSAFIGHLVLGELNRIKKNYALLYDKFNSFIAEDDGVQDGNLLYGPPFEGDDDEVIKYICRAWYEASVSISSLCSVRDIYYLHVLQPTLHDPGAKKMTEEEIRVGTMDKDWTEGVRLGYPFLRIGGKRLLRVGVNFKDLSGVFKSFEDTAYFDCCHFRGKAQELFAAAVAHAFLEGLPPSKN